MADGKQTTEESAKTADGVVSDHVISLSDSDSASSGKKREPQQKGASKAGDAGTSESSSSFVRIDAPQASNSISADTSEELLSYGSGRASQMLQEVQRSFTQVNLSAGASGERVVRTLDEAKSREHPFWNTQPVAQLNEQIGSTENGPIEPDQPIEQVRDQPLTLPTGYKWDTLDLSDKAILDELYKLLYDNYVEDDEALFRFDYSREFLYWALHPPGWFPEWHVGVRTTNGKLLAFISGVPLTLKLFNDQKRLAEINFLCVHKRLRNKRLAPVLIREVTRRVHKRGMFQAVYTAGAYLPKPITTARYWHRSLNPKKLIDIKFSHLGRNMTMQRTIKLYKLPPDPVTAGIRPMTEADVPQTWPLVSEYFKKFDVSLLLDQEEFKHWFLPRENIVYSYVVEKEGKITDFVSFYALCSSVINNPIHKTLRAAYSFYNVAKSTPLEQLLNDALILAKKLDYDVFNALDLMDNESVLKDLKFGPGDGNLHYYLYNWRCPSMPPKRLALILH